MFSPDDKVSGPVSNKLTHWFMQFGQYIDHDMSKTPAGMGKCEELKIKRTYTRDATRESILLAFR